MRKTTTKSDLEATVAELENRLSNLVSSANIDTSATTGKALGKLRYRVVEVLNLSNDARTTILAEIDSMINNL